MREFSWKKRGIVHVLTVWTLAFLVSSFSSLVGFPDRSFGSSPNKWAKGQILVQPRTGLSEKQLSHVLQRSKGRSKAKIGKLNVHIVEVPPQAEEAVARALSRNPHIKFAEVDGLMPPGFVPNDPSFSKQWHLQKIQAPTAWDSSQGLGVIIALLDTGLDSNHQDLKGHLVTGWNAVSQNSSTSDIHTYGHGTAVAGVIGAITNNGVDVAGVAGKGKIMPIRISNRSDGRAYWSDIAKGLNWAADHGAKVANISYSVTNSSTITTAANYFRNKGGVVVNSAGNDGTNPGYSENNSLISVSATTASDTRASFSNYGNYIDVAAPGTSIVTTKKGGGTQTWQGTSFSTPIAAGVVALIRAKNPNLSPSQIETVLEDSADNVGSSSYFGDGRVNAARAVQMAGGTSGGGDTQRPSVSITKPARDATVKGLVPVDVNAADNNGVTRVVLYAGTQKVGEDSSAPYQFSWDSTREDDGLTTLIAYAYDAAGNEGSSGSHPVKVDNVVNTVDTAAPTVSFQQPAPNSTVSGTVQITVKAADNVSLQSVRLYIDGRLTNSTNVSPLSYSWNTRKVGKGLHTLKAQAVDGVGLSKTVQIQVNVQSFKRGKGKNR